MSWAESGEYLVEISLLLNGVEMIEIEMPQFVSETPPEDQLAMWESSL